MDGLMATVLFVCLHNAGRSQMSAALFERAADGRHQALSAGTKGEADLAFRRTMTDCASCHAGFRDRRSQP